MLLIKRRKSEEETVTLELPAFFRKVSEYYYMITEDQAIIRVSELYEGVSIRTFTKDHVLNAEILREATESEAINAYQFMKHWHLSMDHLTAKMLQPITKI